MLLSDDSKSVVFRAAAVAGIAAGLSVIYFLNPATSAVFPRCPFHLMTGLHCPGCGSLRAIHLLAHGDIYAAWRMNAMLLISLPVIVALLLKPGWKYKVWLPPVIFSVIILYGIARNVPFSPFSKLAPQAIRAVSGGADVERKPANP